MTASAAISVLRTHSPALRGLFSSTRCRSRTHRSRTSDQSLRSSSRPVVTSDRRGVTAVSSGAPVYAPALSREIDEEPDERYGDGDSLPGGLTAYFTPGAGTTQHTLLTSGDPGVAFVPDLLVKMPGLDLMLTPAEYVHDPELQRESVERLLGLPFTVLCLSHGVPVVDDPQTAIRAALAA